MQKKALTLVGLLAAVGLIGSFGARAADPPASEASGTPAADPPAAQPEHPARTAAPADPAQPASRSPSFEDLVPRWELGDRWVVETVSRPLQMRGETGEARCEPIQWQFAVARFEKTLSDDCYRVEVTCLAPGAQQPATVLWIDKESLAIRKVQTQLPVPEGFQTVTRSYEFASGQPSPVLGPLTALPLDLPLFSSGAQAKGMQSFVYETHTGPPGEKAVGDVGFVHQVEQQVAAVPSEGVKGLVHQSYTKSLTNDPVVEVQLKSGQRRVRQLWQPGLPWPVYSKNSSTECRLVKVMPAEKQAGQEAEQ